MHTEPIAITKVDNVSIPAFKQRACRHALQGKSAAIREIRVYFCDTVVAFVNDKAVI